MLQHLLKIHYFWLVRKSSFHIKNVYICVIRFLVYWFYWDYTWVYSFIDFLNCINVVELCKITCEPHFIPSPGTKQKIHLLLLHSLCLCKLVISKISAQSTKTTNEKK